MQLPIKDKPRSYLTQFRRYGRKWSLFLTPAFNVFNSFEFLNDPHPRTTRGLGYYFQFYKRWSSNFRSGVMKRSTSCIACRQPASYPWGIACRQPPS